MQFSHVGIFAPIQNFFTSDKERCPLLQPLYITEAGHLIACTIHSTRATKNVIPYIRNNGSYCVAFPKGQLYLRMQFYYHPITGQHYVDFLPIPYIFSTCNTNFGVQLIAV